MLKFSVGYQNSEDFSFPQIVSSYAGSIDEVYFSWVDCASGRSMIGGYDGYFDYGLQDSLVDDLLQIRSMGIGLDLLFNANCYGNDAISRSLEGRVYSIIDYLDRCGLMPEVVTTTSPFIAAVVKKHFENIELKASVNMKIASVKGMEYVAHLFDSYCVAKECNRNIPLLKSMKEWAENHGKKITVLANSGCMRDCSGQIFHDNMVAHEDGISQRQNVEFMPYMCWNFLKNPENYPAVLQNTWIRPEDIHNYENLADSIKLATRAHHLPGMVIGSYVRGRYLGNLLDLFEPGFSPAFAPCVVDSSRIPDDFWKRTCECNKDCTKCDYCKNVMKNALIID